MMTSEDLALLNQYAVETDDGRWVLNSSIPYPLSRYSAEDTLNFVKACLYLGEEVDLRPTMNAWSKIVLRIAALEERLSQLGDTTA